MKLLKIAACVVMSVSGLIVSSDYMSVRHVQNILKQYVSDNMLDILLSADKNDGPQTYNISPPARNKTKHRKSTVTSGNKQTAARTINKFKDLKKIS